MSCSARRRTLRGVYLGKAAFASTYEVTGSLIAVLVWVYYSAQVLFFGARASFLPGSQLCQGH
jgi:membrane protein